MDAQKLNDQMKNSIKDFSESQDNYEEDSENLMINIDQDMGVMSCTSESEKNLSNSEINEIENHDFTMPNITEKFVNSLDIHNFNINHVTAKICNNKENSNEFNLINELNCKQNNDDLTKNIFYTSENNKTFERNIEEQKHKNSERENKNKIDENFYTPNSDFDIKNITNFNNKNYEYEKSLLDKNNSQSRNVNKKFKSNSKSSFKILNNNTSSNNFFPNVGMNTKKNSEKIKTLFSIMSEDIFEKVTKNKSIKINSFEKMINEMNLQKISEKINKNNSLITKNFLTRNKKDIKSREYKKKMNSTGVSEGVISVTRPQSALSNFENYNGYKSNLNSRNISSKNYTSKYIRSPEKFYEDQIQWDKVKNDVLDVERLKSIEKNNELLKEKPELNKRSIEIALKLTGRSNILYKNPIYQNKYDNGNIHNRLTKTKIKNFKNKKDVIYKNLYNSSINYQNLSEKEINNLIEKLYNEHKKNKKYRSYSNEENNTCKTKTFLTGMSSNLIILKDFLARLLLILQERNFIQENEMKLESKLFLNFDEFNKILFLSGFLKFDHNSLRDDINKVDLNNNSNNKEFLSDFKQIEQESLLIKDAWKILISQNIDISDGKLDFNILVIFLIAILGIYRGNNSKYFDNNQVSRDQKTIDLNIYEKSNILIENYIKTNSDSNAKSKKVLDISIDKFKNDLKNSTCKQNNLTSNNKIIDKNNNFIMTFSHSPINLKSNQVNISNILNKKKLINQSSDKPYFTEISNKDRFYNDIEIENFKRENIYQTSIIKEIKKLFPNFDKNNFVYNSYVTNQIRVIFREFYENWADKMFNNKKNKRSISLENKIRDLKFNFKPSLNKSSISHATRFRRKVLSNSSNHIVSLTYEKVEDMTSFINIDKNKKEANLEEIYNKLKIKKERELELERTEKLKKEMIECTFSPKVSSRSRILLNTPKLNASEITEKLYSDARSKSMNKKKIIEEKKALEQSSIKSFPYSPKISSLDKSIFSKSHIRDDPTIRESYERYEKSRIDKKLKEILIKTGSNINTIKNIKNCLDEEKKDEKRARFKFDNETNCYKNTLDSKFKIKNIIKVSNNTRSKIFSNPNSKIEFDTNKTNKVDNEIIDICNKIVLDIYVTKSKKIKFEFFSNQDAVILTQKFLLQNELLAISEFKKNDIFDQINQELKKYQNKTKIFLSQIQK